MPSRLKDILSVLPSSGQSLTADEVAEALGTTRADVMPQLAAAVRSELVESAKDPSGVPLFCISEAGEAELSGSPE